VGELELIEHAPQVGVTGDPVALERRSDRGTKQQIQRQRRIRVIAGGVKSFDQMPQPVCRKAFRQDAARLEDTFGGFGLAIRIEPAAQSEEMDVLVETDELQHLDDTGVEFGGTGHSRLLVVEPIAGDIEFAVARFARLVDRAATRLPTGQTVARYRLRAVPQANQQVVADGGRKQIGNRPDISDPTAANRQRYAVDIGFTDQ